MHMATGIMVWQREVPWAYGFPFNVGLRHPQYVGVVMSIMAATLVAACAGTVQLMLLPLACAWSLMYAIMSAMEQSGDNKKDSK